MEASVERIGEAGLERALAVVVAAFVRDPLARWFYPDAADYLAHFGRFARAFGGRAFDHGTAFASEGLGGVALWLPVGIAPDPDAMGEVFLSTVGPPARTEVAALSPALERYHVTEPHWYLPVIAVDPARQGQGVGSALLRAALAEVDALGVAAYLESSSPANLPLYERHGFEVLGEIQAGSSPVLFPMRRRARTRPEPG